MKRKAVSGILVTLLLMSFLTLIFNIQPVEALTTPLINPVPGQYANYTMYFQNGTAYGWCLVTYRSYETPTLINVSIIDIYGEFWCLVNVMDRIMFEGTNVTWSFWIVTDIKIDDEIRLETSLAKVVDSGIIDAAGFTREYWILESSHPYENITYLWGFDKETGILIYLKSLHPEGETNFMLTSTNIFILADAEPKPAEFEVSDLTITPAEVELGDEVIVRFVITNADSRSCVFVPFVQIGDTMIMDSVELEGHESRTVSQKVTPDTVGDYEVKVDGLEGSFTVSKPAAQGSEPSVSDNIPGFPYESIIIGLMAVIIIIWRARNL